MGSELKSLCKQSNLGSKGAAIMTNKTAIITGGSRGLGRNTAINLARRGVDIVFTWRANEKESESLIREVEAMGRKAAACRTISVP
jgi:NAD(P)-dependent dehydrogenase (short-subunit alcohol dehydrogenase family)